MPRMASNAAMTKERFLVDCPSPPHRAVAGALRLALTGDLAPGVEDDCAETDAMAFAEIAQSHYIDTALAPAFAENGPIRACFPDDLALFINEMAAANARRNARLTEQLEIIGAAFATNGIAVVALKGACELVEPWWSDPGGRYLSDLDLLVSQDDATRASEILIALGPSRRTRTPAQLIIITCLPIKPPTGRRWLNFTFRLAHQIWPCICRHKRSWRTRARPPSLAFYFQHLKTGSNISFSTHQRVDWVSEADDFICERLGTFGRRRSILGLRQSAMSKTKSAQAMSEAVRYHLAHSPTPFWGRAKDLPTERL